MFRSDCFDVYKGAAMCAALGIYTLHQSAPAPVMYPEILRRLADHASALSEFAFAEVLCDDIW